jgi:hypothetical protein
MGHIHENAARNDVRDTIKHNAYKDYYVSHNHIHLMITGTYKEEYQEGAKGWHVERQAPPKAIGGRMLTIKVERDRSNQEDKMRKYIDSHRIF